MISAKRRGFCLSGPRRGAAVRSPLFGRKLIGKMFLEYSFAEFGGRRKEIEEEGGGGGGGGHATEEGEGRKEKKKKEKEKKGNGPVRFDSNRFGPIQ
ncbi:hypothetical protein JCGZ_01680 [Jatropha curcas]|uniref:Uncharacterized protein n=1 Tax=Jatropha curcas TaxID=180498 RepID=A0A067JGM7_JATCU|nr:hypothetical protein JCGZ_01680 [Jatropha curcas]